MAISGLVSGSEFDPSNVVLGTKRGLWPRPDLAPSVRLTDWLLPSDRVKEVSDVLSATAAKEGVTSPAAFAQYANTGLQTYIEYQPELPDGELWQFPSETLAKMAGDCEDFVFLLTTVLATNPKLKGNVFACFGTVSFEGQQHRHAWTFLDLQDGTGVILDYEFQEAEVDDSSSLPTLDYNLELAFNASIGKRFSDRPVESILGHSYSWRWRPPRIRPPRIPPISIPNPLEAAKRDLQNKANILAVQYKNARGGGGDFDDCVAVVAAGCAAYGASKGGPWGAAIGAGGGVPLARIACRRVFP